MAILIKLVNGLKVVIAVLLQAATVAEAFLRTATTVRNLRAAQ